ncbi:magnesium chelatase domain-containing protein [Ferrimonas lipolytica]|uniref:ATP-binding protein n=1 Tax=Ferrimonas lipolytica TaxID=2724191 RepID=A0A6H1UG28_9GAMM|nr:magnesium chelatase domain-containing protein [Ferrimonas lipolytica]QIZ78057.1 ATP-binding protein [Ferrimonas lipolytica]
MGLSRVRSRGQLGIDAPCVTVETHLGGGLPSFTVVGLPETSVRESRERVRAALQTAGFNFPVSRITINLAPADLPKQGGRFDLPIALGILAASAQVPPQSLHNCEFYGELSLTGELQHVTGLLPALVAGERANKTLYIPLANRHEAALLPHAKISLVTDLVSLVAQLHGQPEPAQVLADAGPPIDSDNGDDSLDLNQIIGQQQAKRALVIAASGNHNLLILFP